MKEAVSIQTIPTATANNHTEQAENGIVIEYSNLLVHFFLPLYFAYVWYRG
jgi:hypothetical protein